MSRDRILRCALWATVALNVLGAIIFALPALGVPSPLLPMAVPPYFAAQTGFTIALFAGVYAWLASQPQLNRPLIVVGGFEHLALQTDDVDSVAAGLLAAGGSRSSGIPTAPCSNAGRARQTWTLLEVAVSHPEVLPELRR